MRKLTFFNIKIKKSFFLNVTKLHNILKPIKKIQLSKLLELKSVFI